jgi:hypothetical protein
MEDKTCVSIVTCRPIARQRPRYKELYVQQFLLSNGSANKDIASQWLSNHHVVTPTDTKTTIALQQRNGVFYVVRAEM